MTQNIFKSFYMNKTMDESNLVHVIFHPVLKEMNPLAEI